MISRFWKTRSTRPIGHLLMVAAVLFLVAGCARHHHGRHKVVHSPNAKVVVIEKGHAHNAHCGHYRHGNKWYHAKGHRHGAKCGHHKVKGVWIIK